MKVVNLETVSIAHASLIPPLPPPPKKKTPYPCPINTVGKDGSQSVTCNGQLQLSTLFKFENIAKDTLGLACS